MTNEEIQKLRALCEAATPGPWADKFGDIVQLSDVRQAVPTLIEEVESLRAQLSAMTEARDEACEIALQWAAHLRDLHGDPQDRVRIAALRKVGQ